MWLQSEPLPCNCTAGIQDQRSWKDQRSPHWRELAQELTLQRPLPSPHTRNSRPSSRRSAPSNLQMRRGPRRRRRLLTLAQRQQLPPCTRLQTQPTRRRLINASQTVVLASQAAKAARQSLNGLHSPQKLQLALDHARRVDTQLANAAQAAKAAGKALQQQREAINTL